MKPSATCHNNACERRHDCLRYIAKVSGRRYGVRWTAGLERND